MPSARQLALVLLAGAAMGSASSQSGSPQPAPHERVYTSLGEYRLLVDTPHAPRSRAHLEDRSPGKPGGARPELSITNRVLIKADAVALAVLRAEGLHLAPAPAGYFALETTSVREAIDLASRLQDRAGIEHAAVQTLRPMRTRNPLNDALFANLWHLENTAQIDNDINAIGAWKRGYSGQGVLIGIVDAGVLGSHPDLSAQRNSPAGQFGSSSFHGTAVAGIACAIGDNNEGVAGLAYRAEHSQLFFSTQGDPVVNADAFTHRNDLNDIKNNSWGPSDIGVLWGISQMELDAFEDAVTNGRDGKGVVFTWAAGNGGTNDRVEYDPYAADPRTIAIGAITNNDAHALYSEQGASLFAVTYSSGDGRSITTTSNNSALPYTTTFGMTSAACPLASGAIALCLEANPDLTWRDVQHLIVQTAVQVDDEDVGWTTNGAGHLVNHKYGFGSLDAEAMVVAAETWSSVPPQVALDAGSQTLSLPIPDNDPAGIEVTFDVPGNITIEHVALDVSALGTYIGDLEIVLTSPAGTESLLHAVHNNSADTIDHAFYSVRHWGEQTAGTWTVRVSDHVDTDTHTLTGLALRFLGTEIDCPADQDGNGVLEPKDFNAWLMHYQANDPRADMNENGSVEPSDFSAWIAAYNEGC